jgi:hypothetical protein
MAQKRSKRQQSKQKARERHNRKNKKVLAERREAKMMDRTVRQFAPLPEFRVDTSDSDDDIAQMLRSSVEKLDRVYPRVLSEELIALMAHHVKHGWTDLINEHAASIPDMTRDKIELGMTQLFERTIGNEIIKHAPEHLIRRVLPISSFTMEPGENHWDLRCRSLQSVKTRHGRLFHSPHCPTVEWDGKERRVVLTRHALEQLADRILPSWRTNYIGQIYVFGFLYECVYFETISLTSGQPAIVVYNSCLRAGETVRNYMRDLLKVKTDVDLSNTYYKVGYWPMTVDDDLAVALTFLTPGYWHTPERQTVGVSKGAKLSMVRDIEMACDDGINVMGMVNCERTMMAVKWFHNHGVPQLKKIEQVVFRDMAGPYRGLDLSFSEPS